MKLRPLLLATALFLPVLNADTLRIVDLSELGVTGDSDRGSFSARFGVSPSGALFPGVRSGAILESYVAVQPEGEGSVTQGKLKAALRLKDNQPIDGFVDRLPAGWGADLQPLAFHFDPQKFPEASEEQFAAIRKVSDARLARLGIPGSAWFRHRAGEEKQEEQGNFWEMDSTFRMASGGRAIAENLALDRHLILADGVAGEPVAIESLKGITVPAIDWTKKLKPGEVKVDPLALLVPADQHIVVFPSLARLAELKDRVNEEGVPILQTWDVRNPYRGLIARYESQMGLAGFQQLASVLNPGSVAVTGSDPYFATGSGLALILSVANPDQAATALGALLQIQAKLRGVEEAKAENGIRGWQSPDRSFSVWFAKVDGAVVIANSREQVTRVLAVSKKEIPALGSLDEYRFFRQRYPVGADESAYLFLSDAAIRRWCSPQVRIAASRRNRASAALADLVSARVKGEPLSHAYDSLLGSVTEEKQTVRSSIYNTPGFLTPIAEIDPGMATAAEAAAYNRWREGYERGWAKAFDPIAVRLAVTGEKSDLDVSIIPLTIESSYREWLSVTGQKKPEHGGAQLPHPGAKAFFSIALDHDSEPFKDLNEMALPMLPDLKIKPFDWVGDSLSVYLDDSFFWKVLAKGGSKDLLYSNYSHLPLGVRIESRSSVQLALFLTAVRNAINQSAPNLVEWQQRQSGDVTYVVLAGKDEGAAMEQISVCYAPMKGALLLALDEKVLLAAIARENAKPAASGEHVQLQIHSDVPVAFGWSGADRLRLQREESWAAIPILNEWHRLDATKDPVAFHRAAFMEEIHCPGGQGYRWNAAAATMESVVFGYPAEPRGEEVKFSKTPLNLSAGLTFEDDGLRLRASLAPAPRPPEEAAPATADGVVPEGFPQTAELFSVPEGTVLSYRMEGSLIEKPYLKTAKSLKAETRGEETVIRWETSSDDPNGQEEGTILEESLLSAKDGFRLVSHQGKKLQRTYAMPLPLAPARLAPGVVFSADYEFHDKGEDGPEIGFGIQRCRVVGLEDVEVPAGKFTGCVRIDGEGDNLYSGMITSATESCWYAPGIGLVKTTWKAPYGHGTQVLEKITKL